MKVGAEHKKTFEFWLAKRLSQAAVQQPDATARQIILLLDGAFSVMLVHHDPTYIEEAGRAAKILIHRALPSSD